MASFGDRRPDSINSYRPACPVVFFARNTGSGKQIYTIHCEKLDVYVECYVSTAIVNMTGHWTNQTDETIDCVFALPTPGTIMNVTLNIGESRVITTSIVSEEAAQKLVKENHAKGPKRAQDVTPENGSPYEEYTPDLFRLPFSGIEPNDHIELTCQYLQPLQYYKKGYALLLPLYFTPGTMVEDKPWREVVSVRCKVNAIGSTIVKCWSHKLKSEQLNDGSILVETISCRAIKRRGKHDDHPMFSSDEPLEVTGRDFELSYSVQSDKIMAHAIRKNDEDEKNPDSHSMCVFVTPPTQTLTTFGRAFFFCLDRSGSMINEPYQEATKALFRALKKLRPGSDTFAICAFDHRQIYFKQKLVKASKENVGEAMKWVQSFGPEKGSTVMDVPIRKALDVLHHSQLMPLLVLITDGAVPNEKEIIAEVEKRENLRTRILTLGIGSYCNWFFLKMLAQIGRGFSDVVVYREHICHKIESLIKKASTPVLTDIEIGFKGNDIEIYPYPVPDLFIHSPIVAAARYTTADKPPKNIIIRGIDPKGETSDFIATIVDTPDLPVHKIFVKQQIDLLTAQAWAKDDKKRKEEVIQLSIDHCLPSQYTSLIAFEADRSELDAKEREMYGDDYHRNKRRERVDEESTDGSVDEKKRESVIDKKDRQKSQVKSKRFNKLRNNKGTVAALAIGGTAAVVAVSAATFGDVQATFDNIPILDGFGGIDLDFADNCCGDGCGDCDCDVCGECEDNCLVM